MNVPSVFGRLVWSENREPVSVETIQIPLSILLSCARTVNSFAVIRLNNHALTHDSTVSH